VLACRRRHDRRGGPGTSSPSASCLFRCCFVRTLLSSTGRPTEEGGTVLRPDLAAELPEVSPDGLSWTFRLKQGLRYEPPLEGVEITAPDVLRAIQRTAAAQVAEGSYAVN
jgi:peptide/nickel transport system substrate-binding protein